MKISACIIVKDEAENIYHCIGSFRDFVDEIIVVDTGSTDDTAMIARQAGARVYDYTWNNDFAAARNYALGQASGDWIICLDADEYFAPGQNAIIRKIVKTADKHPEADVITCRMVNLDRQTQRTISIHPTVRIFRNHKIHYQGAIHERVQKMNGEAPLFFDAFHDITIYHTGYSLDILPDKFKRNLYLLEKQLANDTLDIATYYYLSSSYNSLGRYEDSIQYARLALQEPVFQTTYLAVKAYVVLGVSMLLSSVKYPWAEIQAVIDQALTVFPDHPEVHRLQALLCHNQKRYAAAIQAYEKALQLDQDYGGQQINDFAMSLDATYFDLANLYLLARQPLEAIGHYLAVLKINRKHRPALQALLILIREQPHADIVMLLKSIYDDNNEEDVGIVIGVLAQLKIKGVIDYYQHLWNQTFDKQDITLIVTLLCQNKLDQALEILTRYPDDPETKCYTALALILSVHGRQWFDRQRYCQDNIYNRLLVYYFHPEAALDALLTSAELPAYINLLRELMLLGTAEQISSWLKLKQHFGIDISRDTGDAFFNSRLFAEALHEYAAADVQNAPLLYKQGVCCFNLSHAEGALVFFEQALLNGYLQNDIFEYLHWLADQDSSLSPKVTELTDMDGIKVKVKSYLSALVEAGDMEAAQNVIKNYGEVFPDDPDMVTARGVIAILEKKWFEAEQALEKALSIDENCFDALYNLGYLYSCLGRYSTASKYYQAALTLPDVAEELQDELHSLIQQLDTAIIQNPGGTASEAPLVSIVVLADHHLDDTRLCVEAILEYTRNVGYELILVTNGSSDGTQEYSSSLPGAKVITFAEQFDTVNAFNAGMEAARGIYTVVLSNDVLVTANWLTDLLYCMESDEGIGMAAPGIGDLDTNADNQPHPHQWEKKLRLTPPLLLYKTALIREIGYFDLRFHTEDVFAFADLSFRVRRAGYHLILAKDTRIHRLRAGKQQNSALSANGREIFLQKYDIDLWTDTTFDEGICNAIEIGSQPVKVLALNSNCGATPLQVKNRFHAMGNDQVTLFSLTTDAKYLADLESISVKALCAPLGQVKAHFSPDTFDIILVEGELEKVSDLEILIKDIKALLNPNGQLFLKIDNQAYLRNLLSILDETSQNGLLNIFINKNILVGYLSSCGFKDIQVYAFKSALSNKDQRVIQSLAALPFIKSGQTELLSTSGFLIATRL